MSNSVRDLVAAIAMGNAVETEQAFNATMAEKISAKLDDMRVSVAQSMFKAQQEEPAVEQETEAPAETEE
jgi:thymidine phosphorylase